MTLFSFERVEVTPAVVLAVVRVTDQALIRTSARPLAIERLLELLPGLQRHSCENDREARFVDELLDTEMPHLLEHVAVELMALSGSPRSLKARTTWDFAVDGQGVFRLSLSYDDDLVALGALKAGALLVEQCVHGRRPDPAVDTIVEGLRAVRSAPR